jgi:hypothetical protein
VAQRLRTLGIVPSVIGLVFVIAGTLAAIGLTVIVAGLGLIWVGRNEKAPEIQNRSARASDDKELAPVG